MNPAIDYYMTALSPFSYLGHKALRGVAERHGVALRVKPVNLLGIFEQSGAVPPSKRPLVRQRYRFVELQRVADYRGMPINPKPTYWPVDPALADSTIIGLIEAGKDPLDYMEQIYSALWVHEEDIADRAVLAAHLREAGFESESLIPTAESPEIAEIRARNTEEAIAAGAVGAPAYVFNGEMFWGQDRVEYLDRALATGRAPFSADPFVDKA